MTVILVLMHGWDGDIRNNEDEDRTVLSRIWLKTGIFLLSERRDKTMSIIIKVVLIIISCGARGKIKNLGDICSETACGMQISMN